jgi:hypothetical protein
MLSILNFNYPYFFTERGFVMDRTWELPGSFTWPQADPAD